MDVTIKVLYHRPFSLLSEVPSPLLEYHIPGSKILSAISDFGSFLVQTVKLNGSSYVYSIFDIAEDSSFLISCVTPVLFSRVVLQGDFECDFKIMGTLELKANQFNIMSASSLYNILHLQKGFRYISIDFYYTQNVVLKMLNAYPRLEKFKTDIQLNKPCFLSSEAINANATILDCVYKIIHAPYSFNIRKFHLDIITQMLLHMLERASRTKDEEHETFSVLDVEKLYAAKEFIDSKLPRHYSISFIAREVSMNEQKLKKGFKEIFGTGLYGYLQNEILKIARIQVEETNKSIKEIAIRAGYKTPNNFSAAFKKKFGLTPLQWREKFMAEQRKNN